MRIFAPKKEEVAGGWRILHSERRRNLCASRRACRTHRTDEKRITYSEDLDVDGKVNARMDLREGGWEAVD
jgi:hypothetical protein